VEVRAKAKGYFGKLREAGDRFEVDDSADLGSWMEPTETEKRPRRKTAARKKKTEAPGKVEELFS